MTPAQLVGLLVKGSIFLTVFSLGLESSFRDLTGLARKPQQLVRAIAPIYLVMPLVAGLLIALFSHVHPAVKIALFALSVSPIPPLLPKKQLKAGATASYVIGLLVAMSLLAIVFVPLLIEIFDRAFPQSVTILPTTVAEIVLKVILLPLVLGVMTHYALPKVAGRAATILSRVGNIFLLLGVLVILVKSLPSILSLIGNGTVLVAVLFVVIGLVVGHLFGGPDPDDRAALAVSTVSRHPGMALAIAGVNFPEQKLSFAAIALYLLLNTAITAIYLKKIRKLIDSAGSGSAI